MRYLSLLVFVFVSFFAFRAGAELKASDLQKPAALTQEAELLQQVDTISLYLSSERVVFAPRLTKERIIEVESTVIGADLMADPDYLRSFVSRLIETFVSVLKERLPVYAPALVSRFSSDKDMTFVINMGSARTSVATWKAGVWQDVAAATPLDAVAAGAPNPDVLAAAPIPVLQSPPSQASELNEARAIDAEKKGAGIGRKGCPCAARK